MINPATRRVLLPDLEGEMVEMTRPLEEALLALANTVDDGADELPAIFAGSGARAVGELVVAIADASPVTLYGPDGRYQREPLRLVDVDPADIDRLGEVLVELRRVAIETGYRADIAEYLDDYLDAYGGVDLEIGSLLELTARFHGMLDLEWSADHELIAMPAERARCGLEPVCLDENEERAYRGLRERWLSMWHDRPSIDRYRY